MTREELATRLQDFILKAIVLHDSKARAWLLLTHAPKWKEILKPIEGSYIYCCRRLGIKWRELRRTLASADKIPPDIGDAPRYERSHLRVVRKSELVYYTPSPYETIPNSQRASEDQKS